MKKLLGKRIIASVLSLVMVAAMAVSATATGAEFGAKSNANRSVTVTKVNSEGKLGLANKADDKTDEVKYSANDVVRVSIVLPGKSTIDAGYAAQSVTSNQSAKSYRNSLKAQQDALAEKISKNVLDGEKLDVVWNFTLAANIISANVPYGKIEAIKTTLGVADVVIETKYEPDNDTTVEADTPNMSTATQMTKGTLAWAAGYTGAGSKVAIVDTGLDTDHQSFSAEAFQYAIDEINAERETPVALMTAEDVAKVWEELNASKFLSSTEGVYLDAKVPYAVNYVDENLDVTHDNDSQGEHGSHVAGIAAANRYIKTEDGFVDALDYVSTQGEAPDAQLIIMKVFGTGGGAYDSDYFAAIEDAMVLGADSVNLSLGSSVAGFTTNSNYANIINSLTDSNIVWANSAGNNGAWADNTATGELYAEDISFHTGGSPATYVNTLSVASIDNSLTGISYIGYEGNAIFFSETEGYGNNPIATIAGEHKFVYVDTPGISSNDAPLDESDFAAVKDLLDGAIALCNRGTSSFFAKVNAAAANGAIAAIIVNNQAGTINMNLTGIEYDIPAVSILLSDGQKIKATAEKVEVEGLDADVYVGTLTVAVSGENVKSMSSFSSWGGNGALTMKPEITAPGGNIWSVNGSVAGGTAYETMSGTSMASPQIAGISAVLAQYVRENDITEKTGLTQRQLIQSLMMSTATPVVELAASGNEYYYSILKQGAGLVDVEAVLNARSFITMDESATVSAADGKVKAELGEIERGKSFTIAFDVTNFSEDYLIYGLSAEFFTQDIQDGKRLNTTTPLNATVEWTLDGEKYVPTDIDYDFNGDGFANSFDYQHLLDYLAGKTAKIANLENADLDEDGDVDTYDAYKLLSVINTANVEAANGSKTRVTLTVTLDVPEELDVNGNWIEGFITVKEADTEDGALGVTHTIPVLGFYGSITEASMFDTDEDRTPYMAASTALGDDAYNLLGYTVTYKGVSGTYKFGGNPYIKNATYYPERNAINSTSTIAGVQYTLIRNTVGSRFYAAYQNGSVVRNSLQITGGQAYAAYYYANGSAWRNTSASTSLGFVPTGLKEGTKIVLNYQTAPEYYLTETGAIAWDELGAGSTISVPVVIDNTAPYIVDAYVEENILYVIAHDNEYIAAVALYNEAGDNLAAIGQIDGIRRSEQATYRFDLEGLGVAEDEHFLIELYDYATNTNSFKLNLNEEELEAGVTGLSVSPATAKILRNTTTKLAVTAEPWGADEEVTWESSDESIATVDDEGYVTGIAPGIVTITATSAVNAEIAATAEIEVFTINMTAIGALQDEEGTPLMFNWDFEHENTWTSFGELDTDLTAIAYDWNTDDALYMYVQDFSGYMHKVNVDTLETVERSASTTAFGISVEDIDFPFLYNQRNNTHRAAAVAEAYFLYSNDIMENTFNRGWSLSSYLNAYSGATGLKAIAWGGTNSYGDAFYALDNAGMLWVLTYTTAGGLRLGYLNTDLSLTFPAMDETTGNSLILGNDGEFYLAHFNGNTSEIYQLAYDSSQGILVSTLIGNIGDGVWPAALITVLENDDEEADGEDAIAAISERIFSIPEEAITEVASFTAEDAVEFKAADAEASNGTLNALTSGKTAGTQAISTEVTVDITTDVAATNGKITIDYDADKVELVDFAINNKNAKFNAYNESTGKLVLVFVNDEEIAKDSVLLTLKFSRTSKGVVLVTTDELNDEHPATEELIYLGSFSSDDEDPEYGAPVWTWNDDLTAAYAKFVRNDGVTKTVDATITVETVKPTCEEAGKTTYTATVEFNGETYTDTKEVAIEATGHKFGELKFVWTETENGYTAVATFVCENDNTHVITNEATVTSETTPATCEEDGYTTYTATVVIDGKTYTDTKKVAGEKATGHEYSEPTYTWTKTENGYTVVAKAVCEHDETHVVTETVEVTDAAVSAAAADAATDVAAEASYVATYTAKFENELFSAQTKTVSVTAKWTWTGVEAAKLSFTDADEAVVAEFDATIARTPVAVEGKRYVNLEYKATAAVSDELTLTDAKVVEEMVFAGWYKDAAYTEAYTAAPTEEEIANGTAFAKYISIHTLDVVAQVVSAENDKSPSEGQTKVRFVSGVDSMTHVSVKFVLTYTIRTDDDEAEIKNNLQIKYKKTTVYKTIDEQMGLAGFTDLTVFSADAIRFMSYKALVPTEATSLSVHAEYITADGTVVIGEETTFSLAD